MMKKMLLMLSVLVMFLFVVGCSPDSVELTDEEGNLVGQAYSEKYLDGVKYRLFLDDRDLIGYHLQFYEQGYGTVAAFGVEQIVSGESIVVELTGRDYEDNLKEVWLRETIRLTTTDNSKVYFITVEDIEPKGGMVDVKVSSRSGFVKNRLFKEDYDLIGYHLQFYELQRGVVAAFGVFDMNDRSIIAELTGKDYDDDRIKLGLGNTFNLTTTDLSETYHITVEDIEPVGGMVDVKIGYIN